MHLPIYFRVASLALGQPHGNHAWNFSKEVLSLDLSHCLQRIYMDDIYMSDTMLSAKMNYFVCPCCFVKTRCVHFLCGNAKSSFNEVVSIWSKVHRREEWLPQEYPTLIVLIFFIYEMGLFKKLRRLYIKFDFILLVTLSYLTSWYILYL